MKYNRFLPLVIPILILSFAEIYFFKNSLIYAVAIICLLLLFFAVRQFLIAGNSSDAWYNYFICPGLLIAGTISFSTLVTSKLFVQFLFFGLMVLLYSYLRTLYVYLVNFNLRQKESLENFSAYGNFLSFYFITSTLYGIRSFLNFSVWPLMLILLVVTALIIYQSLWINGVKLKISSFYTLLLSLVITELAWTATFLTLSFYILGLIVTICYYILIGLTRFYLKGELDNKVIKLYLIFGLCSMFIVLLSARWFEV